MILNFKNSKICRLLGSSGCTAIPQITLKQIRPLPNWLQNRFRHFVYLLNLWNLLCKHWRDSQHPTDSQPRPLTTSRDDETQRHSILSCIFAVTDALTRHVRQLMYLTHISPPQRIICHHYSIWVSLVVALWICCCQFKK